MLQRSCYNTVSVEKDDNDKAMDTITFYEISAKPYCVYKIVNGEIKILKSSIYKEKI